jgi:hypothetical protein
MIDVDKGQITDNYNRIIAVVYCNNRNLNAELIINATIDSATTVNPRIILCQE